MKRSKNLCYRLLMMLAVMFFALDVSAQATINGHVKDEAGEAVIGASVFGSTATKSTPSTGGVSEPEVVEVTVAAVIIGEVIGEGIFGRKLNFFGHLLFVAIGGIIYYIVIGFVLWLKMPANDLKLFTAIVVAIFLAVPYLRTKSRNSYKKAAKRGGQNHDWW